MDEIIAFITPVSLTKRYPFSVKVFVNWITLYTIIGLVISLILVLNPSGVQRDTATIIVNSTFGTPAFMCACGLIGLAIDSIRGEEKVHDGWYWLLYPFISYIIIAFGVFFIFLAIILFFISLSTGNSFEMPKVNLGRRRRSTSLDADEIRKMLENATIKEIIEKFDKQLEQIEKENHLNLEQKKVVKKLRSLDRSALHSELKNALNDDEVEILFIILLKILSGELS